MQRIAFVLIVAIALMVSAPASSTARVSAAKRPPWTKNCTALNKKYPHGLGKAKATDKTKGEPVTTFRRSTRLYRLAMSYNKGLDGDKDGIACEKK
jgi:Excalibur calcium-binding domain